MEDYDIKLRSFINRMKKLNIDVKLGGNYPWIYLDYVNGKRVTEKYYVEHGYCIGFLPLKVGKKFDFLDIADLFKIIRKYR